MKENANIEELFKSTFESFEADVDPGVWNAVQSGIAAKTAAGVATAHTSAGLLKTLVIAAATLAGGLGIGYLVFSGDTPSGNTSAADTETVAQAETLPEKSNDEAAEENRVNYSAGTQQEDAVIAVHQQGQEHKQKITLSQNTGLLDKIRNAGGTSNDPRNFSNGNRENGKEENNAATQNNTSENNSRNSSTENLSPTVKIENLHETDPIASIVASKVSGPAPFVTRFSNKTEETYYSWDFGDGSPTSTEASPEHIYRTPGTYVVRLTVKNKQGKSDTHKINIEVVQGSEITTVPNIFTPNGDGVNDRFIIEGKNISQFRLEIYSIGGKLIYQTDNFELGWGGEDITGEQVPEGQYIFTYSAAGDDGSKYKNSGIVTVKRKR